MILENKFIEVKHKNVFMLFALMVIYCDIPVYQVTCKVLAAGIPGCLGFPRDAGQSITLCQLPDTAVGNHLS